MVRLPLLAAGLLHCCAANEAAEARPRQPALLLRGAVHVASDAEADGLDGAEGYDGADYQLPPEGQAREDFVRRCTVALSVRSQKMLPLGALEDFCGSTDSVMECKMELVMKLEAVHKRGGSIPGFCEAAYDWFQKKYGMLCPMQCEKLQCRATCQWLEDHKKLQKEAKQLKMDDLEASTVESDLKEAVAVIGRAEEWVKHSSRAVNDSVRLVARAQEQLEEQEGWSQKAEDKVSKLQDKIASLQDARTNSSAAIRGYRGELQRLRFVVDEAELADGILRKRAGRLAEQINETVEELSKLLPTIDRREASLEERWQAHQGMADSDVVIEGLIEDQAVRAADRRKAFLQAEAMLLHAQKAGGVAESALKSYESLVKQSKEAMVKAELVLNRTKHHRAMLTAALDRSSEEMFALNDELDGLMARSEAGRAKVMDLSDQLGQVELAAKSLYKNNLTQYATAISAVRWQMRQAMKEYIEVNKTLDATKGYLTEDSQKLRKERGTEGKLRQALADAQAQQQGAEAELQRADEALQQATTRELALRDKFEEMSGALDHDMQANERALRKLKRAAPKIVRQHGLGLLEVLATW